MALTGSELSIVVTGTDTDGVVWTMQPIGLEIVYAANQIPYAGLELDASAIKMLCDFDAKYRRTRVSIEVTSTLGCMTFDGLIDGLTMHQSFGSISLMMVVKSAYQVLTETYPRVPGIHPTSADLFIRSDLISANTNSNVYSFYQGLAGSSFPKDSTNTMQFIVSYMKNLITNQQSIIEASSPISILAEVITLAKTLSAPQLALAAEKLNSIDTTATDGFSFTISSTPVALQVMKGIADSRDSLFNTLVSMLNTFGCSLVIGANKAFVVPDVGFVSSVHRPTIIAPGEESSRVNEIYPSQYTSISFNDNGYRDIKACYVVSMETVNNTVNLPTTTVGSYVDEDENVKGGVLVVMLPADIAMASMPNYLKAIQNNHKALASGTDNLSEEFEEGELKANIEASQKEVNDGNNTISRQYVDNWAQLKYLQAKYNDRTGNFTTVFDPNWAPSAVGTLYTRHPGTYIDFFVSRVTHRFQMSVPNQGVATTSVDFNCGRMGSNVVGSGIDTVDLFDYNASDSYAYANKFVADVTGN